MNGIEGVAVAVGEGVSVGDKAGVGKNGRVGNLSGVCVTSAVDGYFVDCSAGICGPAQLTNKTGKNHARNDLKILIFFHSSLNPTVNRFLVQSILCPK